MFALLIATAFFDRWQTSLKEGFGETFDFKYTNLRFWSVPIAIVLAAIFILFLFHFFIRQYYRFTAVLFLIVGLCVVFYPTFSVTGLTSMFRLPVNYFVDSMFFHAGAFVAAMGIIGLIMPSEK